MIFCSVADDRAGHKGGKFAYTQKRVYNFLSKYDMIYRYNMWTTEDILESILVKSKILSLEEAKAPNTFWNTKSAPLEHVT